MGGVITLLMCPTTPFRTGRDPTVFGFCRLFFASLFPSQTSETTHFSCGQIAVLVEDVMPVEALDLDLLVGCLEKVRKKHILPNWGFAFG